MGRKRKCPEHLPQSDEAKAGRLVCQSCFTKGKSTKIQQCLGCGKYHSVHNFGRESAGCGINASTPRSVIRVPSSSTSSASSSCSSGDDEDDESGDDDLTTSSTPSNKKKTQPLELPRGSAKVHLPPRAPVERSTTLDRIADHRIKLIAHACAVSEGRGHRATSSHPHQPFEEEDARDEDDDDDDSCEHDGLHPPPELSRLRGMGGGEEGVHGCSLSDPVFIDNGSNNGGARRSVELGAKSPFEESDAASALLALLAPPSALVQQSPSNSTFFGRPTAGNSKSGGLEPTPLVEPGASSSFNPSSLQRSATPPQRSTSPPSALSYLHGVAVMEAPVVSGPWPGSHFQERASCSGFTAVTRHTSEPAGSEDTGNLLQHQPTQKRPCHYGAGAAEAS